MLAQRYGTGKANSEVFVYAAGGYYQPAKGVQGRFCRISKNHKN
jgi:D(-)-tartrate dehydratase